MNTFKLLAEVAEVFETHPEAIQMSRDGATDKERWDWAAAFITENCCIRISNALRDLYWRTYITHVLRESDIQTS